MDSGQLRFGIVLNSVDSGLLCDLVDFVTIASVLPCTNSLLGVMILASPNGYKNNVFANCKKYIVS